MPIRYAEERDKPGVIHQSTGLSVEEFETLVPLVQTAFRTYMAEWTLSGKRRIKRQYSQYVNCPLPTPADRLLFVLVYLIHRPTQHDHAHAFGLTQPRANQWLQVMLIALHNALQTSIDMREHALTIGQETESRKHAMQAMTIEYRLYHIVTRTIFLGVHTPGDRSG